MLRKILAVCAVTMTATAAFGQFTSPPGYRDVVNLTNNAIFHRHACINNAGQVVWESRVSGTNESAEIFLWENGVTTRLTDDDVEDALPEIGDDGTIVWTRFIGPPWRYGPTGEIMMRKPDGTIIRITDDAYEDTGPAVNMWGDVVWSRYLVEGCRGSWYTDIYRFDGRNIQAVTTDAVSEQVSYQSPHINDLGHMVWTRYDFCAGPGMQDWDATIWFYRDGQAQRIDSPEWEQPQVPNLNNRDQAVWSFSYFHPVSGGGIEMWDNGVNRVVTDWGHNPYINDRGDLYFIRWDIEEQTFYPWLMRDNEFIQLSNQIRATDGDIADNGDAVWKSGQTFQSDIVYLQRYGYGDLNCDGAVDAFDIEPFILALVDPPGYRAAFPACDGLLADVNEDGAVDAFDVEPFVGLLTP